MCPPELPDFDNFLHHLWNMDVIVNWPERIKTQPPDDRDNCFQHFDSKGPAYDSEQ